ncbi:hypothetical protein BDW22DRAFT_1329179 [Trametopsis cervina]|nr:hypothetical protein BDW22DRAFT_1329179 [Trametopsis cervina]
MTDELVVKRLHVSGLTPAITTTDLSQKLGTFGTVTALDGFGKEDALGQPRKFGYVTIETTKAKLARCMNLLSGVTWKGTKLRIGEAKLDFQERCDLNHRLAKEREPPADGEPPRKKRRLPRGVQGVHAADMSLVTPENAEDRAGWKVTPLGRVIKPIRMRPGHPLPEPLVTTKVEKVKKGDKKDKKDGKASVKKKRAKDPPVRARRRTIDPLKWGSTQLKGMFLENSGASLLDVPRYAEPLAQEAEDGSDEDSDEEMDGGDEDKGNADRKSRTDGDEEHDTVLLDQTPQPAVEAPRPSTAPSSAALQSKQPVNAVTSELVQEKNAALGLLQSLFGGRGDDEWVGRESVDSDVEVEEQMRAVPQVSSASAAFVDDVEEVPMDVDATRGADTDKEDEPESAETSSEDTSDTSDEEPTPEVQKPMQPNKLKDLFAPQDENAGFSLLGHLDLDLELEDDALDPAFIAASTQAPATQLEQVYTPAAPIPTSKSQARTFDPSLPLFFPLSDEARTTARGRVRDPFDVAREKGLDWRSFCRTQNSDEIKQRWEDQKVDLTKDWKRRHREAIKSRRRRGGGDAE